VVLASIYENLHLRYKICFAVVCDITVEYILWTIPGKNTDAIVSESIVCCLAVISLILLAYTKCSESSASKGYTKLPFDRV